jgi:DNA polymerase I-like protein with 3'-5' exonuclease and polymerase domains
MLDAVFQFDPEHEVFEKREPYKLVLKRCSDWQRAGRRVMIIMQTVDARDLTAGEIMGDKGTDQVVQNAIRYSRKIAGRYAKKGVPAASYAVVNFNAAKHLHLAKIQRREMEQVFAWRIRKMIAKLKPTHILVSGDEAMHALFPKIDHPQFKRGWIHTMKSKAGPIKVTNTLDFYRLLEKDGAKANLLGFWCRHLAWLMLGANPHDLSHIKAEPRYINTIEKFDMLMRRFDAAERVAVDTETKNLSVLHNKIYTMQFCMNQNESAGYVLPIDHPLAHWKKSERLYIKRELRKRYSAKKGPMLITFNGMFDLRIIRQQLKIPFMWLKVWEITFGEHDLDENYTALNSVCFMEDTQLGGPSKFGGLRPIYCSYGNDFYMTAEFGKEDRNTSGTVQPNNRGFLMYGATDVVSIMHIYHEQIRRASYMSIGDHNYKPFFVRHMINQMSDAAHQLSHMAQDGSLVDRPYVRSLLGSESPLRVELKKALGALSIHKEVKQANAELLQESGFKAKSLFARRGQARTTASWTFNFNKTEHKRKLFFDVLGLEAVTQTKKGADAIDKKFIAHHKDRNKIVSLYGEYQQATKLLSTYVKGWYKKLTSKLDEATDSFLRASYGIVDTGRLKSYDPNLQQIPSRGRLVKIIKSMFPAPRGKLLIRFDYSAHEVRIWSIVSGDKVLAESFRAGQKLRQAFIKDPSDENRKAIKEKGDIHILNVLRFFGKLVDKDHPLRDAVKKVVFGVLYGKGAETLGIDTKEGDLTALKSKIGALYEESLVTKDNRRLVEINKALEELDFKLTKLMDEDRTDYAQDIVNKMFQEFKAGARWTEKMQRMAEQEFQVYAPNGRIRHLFAAMTGDRKIVARQVRRGSNAPVQGFASEIGIKAAHRIMDTYYRNLKIFKQKLGINKSDWDMRVLFNRQVHDALYYSVPYEMVVPFIHILLHEATYGVTQAYQKEFNIKFTVEPEIEMEFGMRDDKSRKWDFAMPSAINIIKQAVADGDELGLLDGSQSEVLAKIFKPWRSKSMRASLQDQWPLLGVRNLDRQIADAVKDCTKPYVKPEEPPKEAQKAATPDVKAKAKIKETA